MLISDSHAACFFRSNMEVVTKAINAKGSGREYYMNMMSVFMLCVIYVFTFMCSVYLPMRLASNTHYFPI